MRVKIAIGTQFDIQANYNLGGVDSSLYYEVPADQQDILTVDYDSGVVTAISEGVAVVKMYDRVTDLLTRDIWFICMTQEQYDLENPVDLGNVPLDIEILPLLTQVPGGNPLSDLSFTLDNATATVFWQSTLDISRPYRITIGETNPLVIDETQSGRAHEKGMSANLLVGQNQDGSYHIKVEDLITGDFIEGDIFPNNYPVLHGMSGHWGMDMMTVVWNPPTADVPITSIKLSIVSNDGTSILADEVDVTGASIFVVAAPENGLVYTVTMTVTDADHLTNTGVIHIVAGNPLSNLTFTQSSLTEGYIEFDSGNDFYQSYVVSIGGQTYALAESGTHHVVSVDPSVWTGYRSNGSILCRAINTTGGWVQESFWVNDIPVMQGFTEATWSYSDEAIHISWATPTAHAPLSALHLDVKTQDNLETLLSQSVIGTNSITIPRTSVGKIYVAKLTATAQSGLSASESSPQIEAGNPLSHFVLVKTGDNTYEIRFRSSLAKTRDSVTPRSYQVRWPHNNALNWASMGTSPSLSHTFAFDARQLTDPNIDGSYTFSFRDAVTMDTLTGNAFVSDVPTFGNLQAAFYAGELTVTWDTPSDIKPLTSLTLSIISDDGTSVIADGMGVLGETSKGFKFPSTGKDYTVTLVATNSDGHSAAAQTTFVGGNPLSNLYMLQTGDSNGEMHWTGTRSDVAHAYSVQIAHGVVPSLTISSSLTDVSCPVNYSTWTGAEQNGSYYVKVVDQTYGDFVEGYVFTASDANAWVTIDAYSTPSAVLNVSWSAQALNGSFNNISLTVASVDGQDVLLNNQTVSGASSVALARTSNGKSYQATLTMYFTDGRTETRTSNIVFAGNPLSNFSFAQESLTVGTFGWDVTLHSVDKAYSVKIGLGRPYQFTAAIPAGESLSVSTVDNSLNGLFQFVNGLNVCQKNPDGTFHVVITDLMYGDTVSGDISVADITLGDLNLSWSIQSQGIVVEWDIIEAIPTLTSLLFTLMDNQTSDVILTQDLSGLTSPQTISLDNSSKAKMCRGVIVATNTLGYSASTNQATVFTGNALSNVVYHEDSIHSGHITWDSAATASRQYQIQVGSTSITVSQSGQSHTIEHPQLPYTTLWTGKKPDGTFDIIVTDLGTGDTASGNTGVVDTTPSMDYPDFGPDGKSGLNVSYNAATSGGTAAFGWNTPGTVSGLQTLLLRIRDKNGTLVQEIDVLHSGNYDLGLPTNGESYTAELYAMTVDGGDGTSDPVQFYAGNPLSNLAFEQDGLDYVLFTWDAVLDTTISKSYTIMVGSDPKTDVYSKLFSEGDATEYAPQDSANWIVKNNQDVFVYANRNEDGSYHVKVVDNTYSNSVEEDFFLDDVPQMHGLSASWSEDYLYVSWDLPTTYHYGLNELKLSVVADDGTVIADQLNVLNTSPREMSFHIPQDGKLYTVTLETKTEKNIPNSKGASARAGNALSNLSFTQTSLQTSFISWNSTETGARNYRVYEGPLQQTNYNVEGDAGSSHTLALDTSVWQFPNPDGSYHVKVVDLATGAYVEGDFFANDFPALGAINASYTTGTLEVSWDAPVASHSGLGTVTLAVVSQDGTDSIEVSKNVKNTSSVSLTKYYNDTPQNLYGNADGDRKWRGHHHGLNHGGPGQSAEQCRVLADRRAHSQHRLGCVSFGSASVPH